MVSRESRWEKCVTGLDLAGHLLSKTAAARSGIHGARLSPRR